MPDMPVNPNAATPPAEPVAPNAAPNAGGAGERPNSPSEGTPSPGHPRRAGIAADLFPTTPPAAGQPAAPAAAPGAETSPDAGSVPSDPEELNRGYLRHADYTRKTQELAAQRAQIEADRAEIERLRSAHQPAQPPVSAQPAAPAAAPATVTPPAINLQDINPDDFETDTEIMLAEAVRQSNEALRQQEARMAELERRLGLNSETTNYLAEQQHRALQESAMRAIQGGAAEIATRYGVTVTPEEAGRITQRWAGPLEAEFQELSPAVIVRAWELENAPVLIEAARRQGSAPATPAAPPPSPPNLSPAGARSMPVDGERLSPRERIRRDLYGSQ